ncbi:MAG: helix-turn-helix domain-containing protein [Bacillota bacterium]|nr:helix-turn-helix domain-containing protein [Bacillota bacterium]
MSNGKPGRPRKVRSLADFQTDVLTVEEAAEVLRLDTDVVYRMVAQGQLPAIKGGRAIRIPKGKLARMLGLAEEPAPQIMVPYPMEISPLAGGGEDGGEMHRPLRVLRGAAQA